MPVRFPSHPSPPQPTALGGIGASAPAAPTAPVPGAVDGGPPPASPAPLGPLAGVPPSDAPVARGRSSLLDARTGAARPWRDRPDRSDGYIPLQTHGLLAPAATSATADGTLRFPIGSSVVASIGGEAVHGVVDGFDYKGRAVLDADGARRIAPHGDLVANGPIAPRPSVLATLPPGAVVTPPARLLAALEASLDLHVNGTHAAREYIDAFHRRGYEVFMVGGGVRDAIRTLAKNPDATEAELLELLHDIDIVTTAPPPVARQLCEELTPELDKGGVWSPPFVEQFGVVLAGGKKAGQTDSEGLDICTMKRRGAHAESEFHDDTQERAFATTFGPDLASDALGRDFCCNALYYDPFVKAVVDPTLQGIADAEHELLHPVTSPTKEDRGEASLSPRFWKFRLRGFDTDGEALASIRLNAERTFSTRSGKERWLLQSSLGRVAPKDASTQDMVESWLGDLRAIMYEDRCADLYDRALSRGVRKGVIHEVLKRTTKGLPPPEAHPSTSTGGDA